MSARHAEESLLRVKLNEEIRSDLQSDEELHEAYETLHENEEKYRNIVETANEGIWIVDPEAKTIYVNEKMAEMLGYTPEENDW